MPNDPVHINRPNVNDADADGGWTAQQGPQPQAVADPGYQVQPHQLPDPAVAREAGFPPQQIPASLVVGGEKTIERYIEGDIDEGPDRIAEYTGEAHEVEPEGQPPSDEDESALPPDEEE